MMITSILINLLFTTIACILFSSKISPYLLIIHIIPIMSLVVCIILPILYRMNYESEGMDILAREAVMDNYMSEGLALGPSDDEVTWFKGNDLRSSSSARNSDTSSSQFSRSSRSGSRASNNSRYVRRRIRSEMRLKTLKKNDTEKNVSYLFSCLILGFALVLGVLMVSGWLDLAFGFFGWIDSKLRL